MKLGILGAAGRMGQMILREIASGQYAATALQIGRNDDQEAAFQTADVMIDFTTRDAAAGYAALAQKYKKPMVVGTTGLNVSDKEALVTASKSAPILYSANMSVGITMMISLLEQAAAKLGPEFDIEIFEAHHRQKVDAPSGTALALGHAAAKGRGVKLEEVMVDARQGHTGPRKTGTIGMSVFRGGDVVGEHTVTFAGMGERFELVHKATDRAIFAKGAVKAALWLKNQPPGLYAMFDVLGK